MWRANSHRREVVMPPIQDHLRTIPLFGGMTDRALDAIAPLASEVDFPDGAALTVEGDRGDELYLVLEGTVEVVRGGTLVRTLGTGDVIGEISLVDGRPRTATATARGPVHALVIGREAFGELMERYPAVRLGVMVALADRVRSDERTLVD
jgi:CRP-like cAMP-binding protein